MSQQENPSEEGNLSKMSTRHSTPIKGVAPLSSHHLYRTIYLDPPWPEHGGGKIKRGADKHYQLMTVTDILNLTPVRELAGDDCHLYLWVTNNYLPAGLFCMKEWGFRYINNRVWVKDKIGLGQYFRGQHELLLFGVKGKLPYKSSGNFTRSNSDVPSVIHAKRTEHSRKPPIYNDIEKISYPPYIELYARERMEGWDVWGNEAPGSIQNSIVTYTLGGSVK